MQHDNNRLHPYSIGELNRQRENPSVAYIWLQSSRAIGSKYGMDGKWSWIGIGQEICSMDRPLE